MPDQELVPFRQFVSEQEAIELKNKLIDNDIYAEVADNKPTFDVTFSNNNVGNKYEVKIKEEDFKAAEEIMKELSEQQIIGLPEDYYLFSFKDEELFEIIQNYDEWGDLDNILARKILLDRGFIIDEKQIADLKEQRLNELSKSDKVSRIWIVVSYFLAFTGIYGLIFGYVIMTSTKTIPDGNVIPSYDEYTRKQGKIIFYIGVVFTVIFVLSKILNFEF